MVAVTQPRAPVAPIRVPAVAWMAAIVGLTVVYLMLQENGALLADSWVTLHELFHDGRHAFGVPRH